MWLRFGIASYTAVTHSVFGSCLTGLTLTLNYQHSKIAHVTPASFSSDAQLCSCHNCFSHYRQPPSLHQSVLIFERFAAANVKALIFLYLVHTVHVTSYLRNIADLPRRFSADLRAAKCGCP